jgi:hypothetical protein
VSAHLPPTSPPPVRLASEMTSPELRVMLLVCLGRAINRLGEPTSNPLEVLEQVRQTHGLLGAELKAMGVELCE